MIHQGTQDKGSRKLGASTINSAQSDRQIKTEEKREIDRGLAISFHGAEELEELNKRHLA